MPPRSNARQTRTSTRSARSTVALTPVEPTPIEPAEDTTAKRVSFALKADGTFDLDSMRSSNKDALRKALADPSLSQSLGLTSTPDAENSRLLTQITGGLYDGLSVVGVAFAKRAGYSDAQAAIVAFNEKEKDLLAEPTAKVVNKWFPDLGGKYRDEILLCMALVNVIGAKILLLRSGARMLPNGEIVIGPSSTVAPTPIVMPQPDQQPS